MTVFADTYDTVTPAGSDDPTEADDRMREIKAAVQERENVDHYWPLTGTEVSDADAGEHRKATLRTGSAPAAVADKGFVYVKDVGGKAELFYRDEDGNEIQLTSKGNNLANNVSLKATDNAGTGSVNLIKATTGDIPEILVGAVLSADTAPVVDAGLANKKYTDDTVATHQFKSAATTIFPLGAAPTSFTDLDTGVGMQAMCLLIVNPSVSHAYSFKKKAGATYFDDEITGGNYIGVWCECDSDGLVQWDSNSSDNCEITLGGYIKSN